MASRRGGRPSSRRPDSCAGGVFGRAAAASRSRRDRGHGEHEGCRDSGWTPARSGGHRRIPSRSIPLDRAEPILTTVGDTATPMASAVDRTGGMGDAASTEWAGDDTTVAAVGPGGRVMAVGDGMTSISAAPGAVSGHGVPSMGSVSFKSPAKTTGSVTRPGVTGRSSRTDAVVEAEAAFRIGSPPALPSLRSDITI